jgi:hypothetical protein
MSLVDRLLNEYAAAFRAGDTDPWPYLDQVDGDEREELDRRMDEFLSKVEPVAWDPEAYAGSPAARIVDQIMPSLLVPQGGWRALLPSLRIGKQIKREKVDAELASALDADSPQEAEKVATYYHDMEQGNLDPRGVSEIVLAALSGIYGTTVEELRRAGAATGPPGGAGDVVFARVVGDTDEDFVLSSEDRSGFTRIKGEPDRIDLLFTDPDYDDPDR